jgi:hypothetical protein
MVRFSSSIQLAVFLFIFRLVCASPWQGQTVARLQSGVVVEGHVSTWKPAVAEYLGIRYAEPPVGKLRFAPPKPYQGSGKIVASKFVSWAKRNTNESAKFCYRHRMFLLVTERDNLILTAIVIARQMASTWLPISLRRKELLLLL